MSVTCLTYHFYLSFIPLGPYLNGNKGKWDRHNAWRDNKKEKKRYSTCTRLHAKLTYTVLSYKVATF